MIDLLAPLAAEQHAHGALGVLEADVAQHHVLVERERDVLKTSPRSPGRPEAARAAQMSTGRLRLWDP